MSNRTTSLARTLKCLTSGPAAGAPLVPAVSSLQVTFSPKNLHYGARKFVRDALPRILYANRAVQVDVQRVPGSPKAELTVSFSDSRPPLSLDLNQKHSSDITHELLNLVGNKTPAPRKAA